MKKQYVTNEMKQEFITRTETIKTRSAFRLAFFDVFPVSAIVPVDMYPFFEKAAKKFYSKKMNGYDGIMAEIADRLQIARNTGREMMVNDFLKHKDDKTDLYDPSIRKAIEKKTGCGDWLIDKNATTLEKAIAIYRKKRRLIRWDYDYKPETEKMNGKKSVNRFLSAEEQAEAQKRSNPKKAGTNYPVCIHIETTYARFFDYLETYPAGINTFFKLQKRAVKPEETETEETEELTDTDENNNTTFVWQMQTIKNSKKKIAFLEHFPVWDDTGLSLEEYEEMNGETDEE